MSTKEKSHKKESTKKKLEEKSIALPKTKKVEETSTTTTTIESKSKKVEKTKKAEENKKVEESITTPKTKKDKTKKETSATTTTEQKAKKVEETSATITKTTPKTKKDEKNKKVEETSTESKVKKADKSKKVEEKKTAPAPAPPPKENKTTTINKKQNEKVEQTKKPQQLQQQKQQQKRKLEEIESSSSESESEEDLGYVPDSSDDSDDDSDFDEIQADFDIVPSVDKDYHSIKNMIVRLVPYNETLKFNAGELTDLIIEQATKKKFGRSINIDGSEDPYGFISILNYQLVKNQPTIQGYIDYINEKLLEPEETFIDSKLAGGEKSMKSYLSKLLNQSKTNQLGLIFSERFINIPNQLAHPIYQFMQFDVELMQEKNNDKNYDFKNYLVFTSFGITSKPNEEDQLPPPSKSMNVDDDDDDSEDHDEQPIKKSKSNKGTINKKENKSKNQKSTIVEQQQQEVEEVEEGLVLYQKCEDKYFREYASAWSTFDIPYLYGKGSKWTLYSNMIKKGLIMIIPASKYQQFLNDLKEKAIYD
ncbi:hypothetical protein DDB_G0285653 [Dictyostelium discoideum AX4]|uniref:Uncharacterized protein n=1 Tax=Dictyostelium discoideum TaxID=44689 RepID=Q54MU5_DICDI|nr:hypothetical protein DDB_G0285653 [Dictyostelium discoideum AX4]EAL64664.1 hypothetical protein DDB_G0285653 [Dictyostelium discoideum AX4]|eukprot:XP_638198.1 hypothetical protein DDB_G0285653 [Dictyostelium discoideum AX4]